MWVPREARQVLSRVSQMRGKRAIVRMIVIGVDPGGRWSGGVVRAGDNLVDFMVIECTAPVHGLATIGYARDVSAWVSMKRRHMIERGHAVLIGVEGLRPPTGFGPDHDEGRHKINPTGLMGTAGVYFHLLTIFPDAIEVEPGGRGSAMLAAYPRALVGPREKRANSKGILRHARSAWDVAGATKAAARLAGL